MMKVRKLNEAFSPSMPKWLQNFIMYNPRRRGPISKAADPQYAGLKYNYNRDVGRDSSNNLASNIIRYRDAAGDLIDFSRANFIEAPVPSRVDDPIFSDTDKMCFVYLKSDTDQTVWIPRYSSPKERFTYPDSKTGEVKTINIEYLNNKLLKQFGSGFCYIDLNDKNNFTGDRIDQRRAARAGSVDRIPDPEKYNRENRWSSSPKADKSGYLQIPLTKRYEDQLRDLRIKNAPEKLHTLRNNLVTLNKEIYELRSEAINTDFSDSSFNLSNYDYMMNDLQRAAEYEQQSVRNLVSAFKYLDKLNSVNKNDTYEFNRVFRGYSGYLDNSKEYLNKANELLRPYVSTSIDWDISDDSIYTDIDIDDNF